MTQHKLEQLNIQDIKPYDKNSRKHSVEQVHQIAESIKQFGFNNPILVSNDNTIIAGHGRFEAAKSLGLEFVPVVRLTHLTPAQVRAYVVADNKLALNAEWDNDILRSELQAIKDEGEIDLSLLGFNLTDINYLMTDIGDVELSCKFGDAHHSVGERKVNYEKSIVRQIILIYGMEEYNNVIDAMAEYADKFGLSNNTEVVNHLLESNGYQINIKQS